MKKPSLKIRLFHLWFRLVRPMTLGVRILLQNEKSEILLVRHGYVKGWHLPGGGVEVAQTCAQAVAAELLEETGITMIGEPKLLGIFANRKASKRDHVTLYKVHKWERKREFKSNYEIAEIGFFPLDTLPEGTTQSTLDRVDEVFGSKAVSEYW